MTTESLVPESGDPRLTAFALGQLEGAEQAAFESAIADDAGMRAEVEAIRTLSAELETTLRDVAGPGLDPARREAVLTAGTKKPRRSARPLMQAAVALVGIGLVGLVLAAVGPTQWGLHRKAKPLIVEMAADTTLPMPDERATTNWSIEVGPDTQIHLEPSNYVEPEVTGAPHIDLVRLTVGQSSPVGRFSEMRPRAGVLAGMPPAVPAATPAATQGGESYEPLLVNGWLEAAKHHTSTFSVDVDTASYSNVRRFLTRGQLPPPAAVRLEELINYFDYDYAPPEAGASTPFRTHVQVAQCPWAPTHRLARIGLKGRVVETLTRPAANLVFLVDVSGSMADEDKLPLLKTGLEMLTETLRPDDRVGIVTYAGQAGVALETTAGSEQATILGAIRALSSGGSTNGEAGIQVAYDMVSKAVASKAKGENTVNRVILCTDGDFNVGLSETSGLVELIQQKAKSGVFLSVLGFGTGNYKDAKMEALSNKGNGNYAYIDGQREARRVLVEQASGTLVTIAKDVKIQVFFNPKQVQAYRLLGYENRRLAARDFNDDTKDAGEIGAGHAVTALYEIVPTGATVPGRVDPNPFVQPAGVEDPGPSPAGARALFRLRLRWKAPNGTASALVEQDIEDTGLDFGRADPAFQWAAAVAGYGMLLRGSPHAGEASWALVEELAQGAEGDDPTGRRAEFLGLVAKAKGLAPR